MISFQFFLCSVAFKHKRRYISDFCSLTPARQHRGIQHIKASQTFLVFERQIRLTLFTIHLCASPFYLPSLLVCLFVLLAILGSPASGIQNTIGSVGAGQQNATSLSNPNPIDPSSMQRAYAALGLPYMNQPQTQLQPQVPGQQPAQPPAHQQMRTLNALGKSRSIQEQPSPDQGKDDDICWNLRYLQFVF